MRASLLVPCFNAAAHLPRLFASVRAQTLPFAEVICYDDASTDDTARVATDLGASVLRETINRGPAAARNRLWRAARTEWVHFHDADDLMDPRYHEEATQRATADTDVVICAARWLRAGDGQIESEWHYSEGELAHDPVGYLLSNPVGGINGLYRTAALAAIGGYDERLRVWEDADLHVRLALHGARFAVIEKVLVTALRHGTGISAPLAANWRCRLQALEGYAGLLPAPQRPALLRAIDAAARELLAAGDGEAVQRALALSRTLGGTPPASGNPLVRAVRSVCGATTALRLQLLARRLRTP